MAIRNDPTFYLKYLLPFLALVMTYVVADQSYMGMLNESDLSSISAKVISISQSKFKKGRSTIDRISITLDKTNQQPYFLDNNPELFPTIINNIQSGDFITLYHRTKMQAKIGLGNEIEILKIRKGAQDIYSLEKAKQPFISLRNYLILPAIILWILYFYFRKKRRQEKGCT